MIKRFLLTICLLASNSSWSGETIAPIHRILIYELNMLVYVYPVGGVVNPPACHGAAGDFYSFSLLRPAAKEYLDALLSAQARKVNVDLVGKGDCIDYSVSETLSYFRIDE